ncbi:Zn(II)2Cys6 transcription factor [Rhodotorula paludigena]|uniref:Zn(II)2Cys6 transcription factor n=1 Tax=Rhodotorula paludigena TaxID=86838 RepID=UPI003171439C
MPPAHLDFELRPANESEPLRRSRTGCLTCRKRKKKCPEQLDFPALTEPSFTFTSSSLFGSVPPATAPPASHFPDLAQQPGLGVPTTADSPFSEALLQNLSVSLCTVDDGFEMPSDLSALLASIPDGGTAATAPPLGPPLPAATFLPQPCPATISAAFSTAQSAAAPFAPASHPNSVFASLAPPTSVPASAYEESFVLFCIDHVLPAWSATYPPATREVQTKRYRHMVATHEIPPADPMWSASSTEITVGGSQKGLPAQYRDIRADPYPLVEPVLEVLRGEQRASIPLEAQLYALSDLHIALGAMDLPEKSYEVAATMNGVISRAFNSPSPVLNLSQLKTYSSFAIHAYAMIDFSRSIARREKTFVTCAYTHGEEDEEPVQRAGATGSAIDSGAHEMWFGLPSSLTFLLASATNLCASAHAHRTSPATASTPLPAELQARAYMLVDELESWRPRFSVYDQGRDRHAVSLAAEIGIQQETWRQTGLLLLHRHVFLLPPSHALLCPLLRKLLASLKAIYVLSQVRRAEAGVLFEWWSALYSTVAFLTGALVREREERDFIRRFIGAAGREPAYANLVKVLEATWLASDEHGGTADWYDVAREKGIGIVFF